MRDDSWLGDAAQFLKVMGNAPRLRLLLFLSREPAGVSVLAQKSGMSQAVVSQHLRTLRLAGVARAVRSGREVTYHVADHYVTRILMDSLAHVDEPRAKVQASPGAAPLAAEPSRGTDLESEERLHTRHLHRLDAIVKTFMTYEHMDSHADLGPES